MNLNNSNIRISKGGYHNTEGLELKFKDLQKENIDLKARNQNLELRLKKLEKYINENRFHTNNSNIYNINLTNNKNNESKKNKRAYTPTIKRMIYNTSKSQKIINKDIRTKNLSKRNKLKLNRSNILPSEKFRLETGQEINDNEKDEYNLKVLNEMIEEKKNAIKSLEYEINLQKLAKKGEGYLDYELDLWQKKTNTLTTSFYQQFNNIKSEAFLDKNEIQKLIHNMKKICEKNQNFEENIIIDILNKQVWLINNLSQKNEIIKKKLDKMKNIFK